MKNDVFYENYTDYEAQESKTYGEVIRIIFVEAIICTLFVFILNALIICYANVPSGSMKGTININDKIIGNRLAYLLSKPKRGDVVIFKFTEDKNTELYIKRLIGLPGDAIEIEDATLYVNGKRIYEDYLYEDWVSLCDDMTFEVPAGCYFFLGDNRNHSYDSRCWSNPYIKSKELVAKAEVIVFPFCNARRL